MGRLWGPKVEVSWTKAESKPSNTIKGPKVELVYVTAEEEKLDQGF